MNLNQELENIFSRIKKTKTEVFVSYVILILYICHIIKLPDNVRRTYNKIIQFCLIFSFLHTLLYRKDYFLSALLLLSLYTYLNSIIEGFEVEEEDDEELIQEPATEEDGQEEYDEDEEDEEEEQEEVLTEEDSEDKNKDLNKDAQEQEKLKEVTDLLKGLEEKMTNETSKNLEKTENSQDFGTTEENNKPQLAKDNNDLKLNFNLTDILTNALNSTNSKTDNFTGGKKKSKPQVKKIYTSERKESLKDKIKQARKKLNQYNDYVNS